MTSEQASSATPPIQNERRLLVILAVLALTEINSAFEVGMVYGIIGSLVSEFGASAAGWIVSSFLLMGAISAALGSRLGDIFGRRKIVMILLALSGTGSVINALAEDLTFLIVGRTIQGVAAALLPLCIGLVREYFPAQRVPKTIGWLTAIASFSAMLGIVLGGAMADTIGWRSTFWVAAVHAFVSLALVALILPKSKAFGLKGKLDWLGGILFAPAIAALLLAVELFKTSGASDPRFVAVLGVGLVLMVAWVRREMTHANPMLDVRLLATRQLGLSMLLMTLFGLGSAQLMLMLLLIGQQPAWTGIGIGLTATVAAWLKVPSGFIGLVGAPWSGSLAGRSGARVAALVGTVTILAGWIAFASFHDSVIQLVLCSALCTFGGAVLYAAIPNLVVEVAPADRTAELNGMSHVFRTVGTAIGTQMVTLLLASSTAVAPDGSSTRHPSPEAYSIAFTAIIIAAALSVVVTLLLPRLSRPATAGS